MRRCQSSLLGGRWRCPPFSIAAYFLAALPLALIFAGCGGEATAPAPTIEKIVRFHVDDSGEFVEGPHVESAPAGALITVVGEHFPADPRVTIGGVEMPAVADETAITTFLPLLEEHPETVEIAISDATDPAVAVSINVTIDAPETATGDPRRLVLDFIAAARRVLAGETGDEVSAIREEIDGLDRLLAEMPEHEVGQIASALHSSNALSLLKPLPPSGPRRTAGPRVILSSGVSASVALERWDALSAVSLQVQPPHPVARFLKIMIEATKHLNLAPDLNLRLQTTEPLEGGHYWFWCEATDRDGMQGGAPSISVAHGDAVLVTNKPLPDPGGVPFRYVGRGEVVSAAEGWTTKVTGNLRVVAFRCEATDSPRWAKPKTAKKDPPVVIRETLEPEVVELTTRKSSASTGDGAPEDTFRVGERFDVLVRVTDDVNPDPRSGYEPFGIRFVTLGMSHPVRVANRVSFVEQTVSAAGGDLLRINFRTSLGFRGDYSYVVDPGLRYNPPGRELRLVAILECREAGTAELSLHIADTQLHSASAGASVTCITDETLPDRTPTPIPTPTPDETPVPGVFPMTVLVIDGEHWPLEQFRLATPDACGEDHYHGAKVYSFEGSSMTDPNPDGCGFGTEREIPVEQFMPTGEQMEQYRGRRP